ncbi:putative intercellular signal essential for a variety of patterning events during development [Trypoxylus dichotomus]
MGERSTTEDGQVRRVGPSVSALPMTSDECEVQEMRWCAVGALILALVLGIEGCGPGRGVGRKRGPRKLTPLVFKQHLPNEPENSLGASGQVEGRISKNDSRFKDLVLNYNRDIIFKDEEGTGADRLMTQKCNEKLNTLAISVMNQWPGVQVRVTEAWDEEGHHSADSLHYEGRAVDITTSDRDRSKYGMLARLAVEAGFDWVYYESRSHIHCSVKSESSQGGKYGGCFSAESTVLSETGTQRKLQDLQTGERILSLDLNTQQLVFSEVILFLDWDPSQRRDFLQFKLRSGRTLTVTPSHLLFQLANDNTSRTIYAAKLSVGDRVLVRDSNRLIEDAIVMVQHVAKTGVFAPLTMTGTVVVDGVLASCYATIDSQSIAHWAFSPIRLMLNFNHGLHRIWTLMLKPVEGWEIETNHVPSTPSRGVYWYAEILYVFGDYLIPHRIYK